MQYRTATRLTDLRLVVGRGKYLYCDTEVTLPEGSRINAWGGPFKLFSDVKEDAVYVSIAEDKALLRVLLSRHNFVISIRSADYAAYQRIIQSVLNDNLKGFRESIGGYSIADYLLKALVANKACPTELGGSGSFAKMDAFKANSIKSSGHLVGQRIYLTRVPEDIALMLWTRFVNGPIDYYELDEGGSLTKLNLVDELANTCTNFESTMEYGCTTCNDRNGCLDYLSGGQLSTDDSRSRVSLKAAKNLLVREGLNYIPPSVVGVGGVQGVVGKLDFAGVNIAAEDTAEKYKRHKLKYVKLKDSAKFLKEQCQNGCSKEGICDTRGIACSSWKDGYPTPSINQDYCTGAKEVVVTPDNLELYIRTIFELVLYNAGFNSVRFEQIAEIPGIAANKIVSWVFKGSHLDKHASACIRYLEECPSYHYPASVIPVEIEQALKMLGLSGGYGNPREWWSHSMTTRTWVESKTEYYEECFPGISGYPKNKWVVMTLPSMGNQLASPRGSVWNGSGVAESIDTSLYANMYNLRVKGRKSLKRFVTIESRMHLALTAIKMYVSPGSKMMFGPYTAKRDFGPTALYAEFTKNAELRKMHWYFTKDPTYLSSTELVLDILSDIANTPAKYNLHSLGLLSSLGELVDK